MPRKARQLGRTWLHFGVVAAIAAAAVAAILPVVQNTAARADGGDFMLDFIAAAPETYVHQGAGEGNETGTGALQFDSRDINTHVRESLEAEDFACGDRVIFFTEVTTDEGADGAQSIDLHYNFDARNNGQQGVGYRQVLATGLSNVDFAGQTQETGNELSGNESVSLISQVYSPSGDPPPAGFGATDVQHLLATVRVTGLEAGEVAIVRTDVRFACFASDPTGNLHAAIDSAAVVAGGSGAINVGQQDVPMLGLGELPAATPTITPTRTPTSTPRPTNTPTRTPRATHTPTNTPTRTPRPPRTPTNTPTRTPTNTPTNTPVTLPTFTPTPTRTSEVLPTAVGPTPTVDVCKGFAVGDVNGPKAKPGDERRINAIDAAFILQYDARLINHLNCPVNADVNLDGEIDSRDALLILQYIAGYINHLPVR